MRLDEIVRGIAITDRRGLFEEEISNITVDSRRVCPGSLFVAVRGAKQDGHGYIAQAIARGASAVLGEEWPEDLDGELRRPSVLLVPKSRRALALAAASFTGHPSRKLLVAGVTGTNGKTTVTYLLESIIQAAGKKVGVIGTVDCRWGGHVERLAHTTPDPITLQRRLADMLSGGVTHVAMEVSSHALEQDRVAGVHFKVAGFTNLTQDHLDYHQDLEQYFEAKSRLFSEFLRRSRARGRMAVVNIDDPNGERMLSCWQGKAVSVSLDPSKKADIVALEANYTLDGVSAVVRTAKGLFEIETALIGPHNLQNALIAVGMALAMGLSKARILRGLRALERVPGRLERIPGGDKKVFVDYAHTPDALEKAMAALRPHTKGRLIVVFGCGGDRDSAKRTPMGAVVARGADVAIVTNDNPRTEDPHAIAAAVELGLQQGGFTKAVGIPMPRQYEVDLDRRNAIRSAFQWMTEDDALLIAGKGHEDYQIIGHMRHHFDDREEARRALLGLPPPPPEPYDEGTHEIDPSQIDGLELDLSVTTEVNLDDASVQEIRVEDAVSEDLELEALDVLDSDDAEIEVDEIEDAKVEAQANLEVEAKGEAEAKAEADADTDAPAKSEERAPEPSSTPVVGDDS